MTTAASPTPRAVPPPDTAEHASSKDAHRANGPNPGVLAAVSLGLTLASLAASAVLAAGTVYVSPFAPTGQLVGYYQRNGTAARVSAALLFGSAVPLGIFAATAYTRLRRLGVRVPGPSIGFFGGITAGVMLMLSAAAGSILGRPELGGDAAVIRALSFLAFYTGGIGYVVGVGLLVAGLAVPCLVLQLVPRWLGWAGLAIAAVSEVAFLSMMFDPLQMLLPVGRFGGLAWLVAVGFLLPAHRDAPAVPSGQEQ